MKKVVALAFVVVMSFGLVACDSKDKKKSVKAQARKEVVAAPERPTDAELHAFKAYHHAIYMVITARQAGGTNKLIHTTELPTEGTDPVVTPALDHLYSKAIIDLTSAPVVLEIPEIKKDRYFSLHITDQEHYTIYDEIHPLGTYVFVRRGKEMKVPEGAKVIESPGDYPHLFFRVQVKNDADKPNTLAVQQMIKLTGASKELAIENPVEFTIETHDVYSENSELLASVVDFSEADYKRVSNYVGYNAPSISSSGNIGLFGPIDSKEPNSNDPVYRATAIIGHLGLPLHHAYYAPIFTNCKDEVLNGDKKEVFTFPYKPKGVELFWSVTRYSALTRNTISGENDIFNAYNTQADINGNITVTFSADNPKDGTYWMPVNRGEPYYFVVRYYKPNVDNLPKKPCN
jgi:hypothetical protein